MEQVLPVVIGCSVGIALCVVYLICLALKGLMSKFWANHPKHIEIEDNVLTIDLKKRKKQCKIVNFCKNLEIAICLWYNNKVKVVFGHQIKNY